MLPCLEAQNTISRKTSHPIPMDKLLFVKKRLLKDSMALIFFCKPNVLWSAWLRDGEQAEGHHIILKTKYALQRLKYHVGKAAGLLVICNCLTSLT